MKENNAHGGNIYQLARQQGNDWHQILDFSANINPLGLPASVRAAALVALDAVIHYPDPRATALKLAISENYHVATDTITIGNGAVELLYLLCYQHRPDRVVIPAPAFSEYSHAARAAGAQIHYIICSPAENFSIDIEKMITATTTDSIVFLGNPNNPTGTLLEREKVAMLLTACAKKDSLVVVDESFIDFLPNEQEITCRPLLAHYDNLIILHSLTKFFAIPGLRLGFALTSRQLAKQLEVGKDPWNVNSLAQVAGVAALADETYRRDSRQLVTLAKTELYTGLSQISGFLPFLPSVNFILVDVSNTGKCAAEWNLELNRFNIMVRDCSNYPGLSPYYLRVAVKLPEQNEYLLRQINEINGR